MRDPDRDRREGLRARLNALGLSKAAEPRPDLSVLSVPELKALRAIADSLERPMGTPPPRRELFCAEGRAYLGREWPLAAGVHVVELTIRERNDDS